MKKIRNVNIDVCCAEQKLAYNICFNCHINFGKDTDRAIEHVKNYGIHQIPKKYDVALILWLVENHIVRYMLKPFIGFSYNEIGDFFNMDTK